jgi:serine/threonine protein kinase
MKITEKSDVYSFGVVLLELLTGRRPIQPVEDGGDLVTCVRSSIQTTPLTSGVFDDRLDLNQGRVVDSMVLVLKIALLCTSAIPSNRPTMRQVVSMLIDTKREINESSSPTEEKPLNEDKK